MRRPLSRAWTSKEWSTRRVAFHSCSVGGRSSQAVARRGSPWAPLWARRLDFQRRLKSPRSSVVQAIVNHESLPVDPWTEQMRGLPAERQRPFLRSMPEAPMAMPCCTRRGRRERVPRMRRVHTAEERRARAKEPRTYRLWVGSAAPSSLWMSRRGSGGTDPPSSRGGSRERYWSSEGCPVESWR